LHSKRELGQLWMCGVIVAFMVGFLVWQVGWAIPVHIRARQWKNIWPLATFDIYLLGQTIFICWMTRRGLKDGRWKDG